MKKLRMRLVKCARYTYAVLKVCLSWIILHCFCRNLLQKDIWLICEKRNEARDNGFHFFKYLREKHPEINSYYVIDENSPDLQKVTCYGNVVISDTIRHCVYFLAAKYSISSQAYGAFPYEFNRKALLVVNKFCRRDQKTVFLQHGIIKDELSHGAFDYHRANIDFFVCSAQREYEFVKELYGYPSNAIGCVGLCRFDNLYSNRNNTEKIILAMPTWRRWLKRAKDGVKLSAEEIANFTNSEFYIEYKNILKNPALQNLLIENGYKLYFYMHFQLQDYTPVFKELENDNIVICDRYHYDVQDLLLRSRILVTDYSSVYFDFAFMNKPMVYFQFDRDRFTQTHYAKGYFEYEKDGFGPCLHNTDEVVKALGDLICLDGKQIPEYAKRVNDFFTQRDDKNCERTYEAILRL